MKRHPNGKQMCRTNHRSNRAAIQGSNQKAIDKQRDNRKKLQGNVYKAIVMDSQILRPVSTNKGSVIRGNPNDPSNRRKTGHDAFYQGLGTEVIAGNINMVN